MVGFDPEEKVAVLLDCVDGGKPEAERARFLCRHLTSRQAARLREIRQQAYTTDNYEVENAKANEAVLFGLVGWEGLKDHAGADVPFSAEALDEHFTVELKLEMAREYPDRVALSERDRKNSRSHSTPAGAAPPSARGTGSAAPAPA